MKPQLIDISLAGARTIRIKTIDQQFLDTPFHFHHLCELVWIEKSFGKRIVGDNIDNFEDGDLVLMGPNLPHIWQNDEFFFNRENHPKVKSTVIYFPPDFLLNLTDEAALLHPIEQLVEKSYRGLVFFGRTKKKIISRLRLLSKEKDLRKIIVFLELIHLLSESSEYRYLASVSYKNLYHEKDTDRIDKVYQYMMQNFQHEISLGDVAALCNMTTNAFCRYFKSRTQKSPIQFLNELRIGHASKLLRYEAYSISDVCYECGYNNTTNFNKFFKAIHKITPTEYRKRILGVKAADHPGTGNRLPPV